MPFWYYFCVPKLPSEVAHQSNMVEIKEYLVPEGTFVDVGSPVVIVENHWAAMTLKANGKGIIKKTFFEPGTQVKVGDPIAVVDADGEAIPYDKEYVIVDITEHKRQKPSNR